MMTRTLSLALLFVVVTWTLATNCEIEDDINENFQVCDPDSLFHDDVIT